MFALRWGQGPFHVLKPRRLGLGCVGVMLQGTGCGTSLVCLLDANLSLGSGGAEADGWRERSIIDPTPDRGSAQAGHRYDVGFSQDSYPDGSLVLVGVVRYTPRSAIGRPVGSVWWVICFFSSALAVVRVIDVTGSTLRRTERC